MRRRRGPSVRCAWCPALRGLFNAEETCRAPACCWSHRHLGRAILDAFHAWHPRGSAEAWWDGPHHVETWRLRDEVIARDDRELRGVGVDWSRPVEGWVLFEEERSEGR